MATIALRVPTTTSMGEIIPNGQCYVLFTRGPMLVRDVIAEKVRAELRKARSGGLGLSSINLLVPDGTKIDLSPVGEIALIKTVQDQLQHGSYLLLYNGLPCVDLDETIDLDRQTSIVFLHIPAWVYQIDTEVCTEIGGRDQKNCAA